MKISLKFVQQYSSIASDNSLSPPVRRQAIIWTNDVKSTDAYMHHWLQRVKTKHIARLIEQKWDINVL